MFKHSPKLTINLSENAEPSHPLLSGRELDDHDVVHVNSSRRARTPQSVTFKEEVQRIPPPFRSTASSTETRYDFDGDDLDEDVLHDLPLSAQSNNGRRPPVVGFLVSPGYRRSVEGPTLPLHTRNGSSSANGGEHPDLAAIAAKRTAGGGMLDSIANLANALIGAAIIGLPYALRQAGFVTGVILLVLLCYVTDWTICLNTMNAKLSGGHSYMDIMTHCFGSSGRATVSFFQFAFAFGAMCAYGVVIGDTIPHVLRFVFPKLHTTPIFYVFADRQFVIAFCVVLVSYPLSLYRDVHKLAGASGLALVGMLIIVCSVLVEGPHVPPQLKGTQEGKYTIISPGIFQAIGVISFAFVCHHNSFLIYGSLRMPTLDRFATVTHVSTFISLVASTTLAVSAYLVFTDKTQGNILNNFPVDNTLINVARFSFGFSMFTTLPMDLFVCREVVEQYFFPNKAFSTRRHVLITSVILFSSVIVALLTCDLGVMLEITGGVSATTLAWIFPAACYFTLVDKQLPWYGRTKLPAVMCGTFGVIVMIISLYLALAKTWTAGGPSKICL